MNRFEVFYVITIVGCFGSIVGAVWTYVQLLTNSETQKVWLGTIISLILLLGVAFKMFLWAKEARAQMYEEHDMQQMQKQRRESIRLVK